MKIFVDTANSEAIERAKELGLADGVTTNPTLIAREEGDPEAIIRTISEIIDGPVNTEVLSTDCKGMLEEAREMNGWGNNISIKIPMTKEGLKAVHILAKEGIKTNVTLIFSATQAILAAKAGASYVSPFVGRLEDISHIGMEVVHQIATIYSNYEDFDTQIIVASIRLPQHVIDAAMMGADIATIPPNVLDLMEKHPLTDRGLAKFLEDAKKYQKK